MVRREGTPIGSNDDVGAGDDGRMSRFDDERFFEPFA
jgi:hypothetical protein